MAQEYQRKQFPFLHLGMNWNSPPEKLQDGQIWWGKNIRVLEQGTISSAHGFTPAYNVPPLYSNTVNYLHSMSRLNILNEQLVQGASGLIRAFDPQLARTYVLGADESLYVFQDQTTLVNQSINPVLLPVSAPGAARAGFSGNPLSMVDMQPVGAAVAWKYVGDSQQMVTVGYYPYGPNANTSTTGVNQPADQYDVTMARALTIGMDPPPCKMQDVNPTLIGATGNLNGAYQWCFVYRRLMTGARSNPSPATRGSSGTPAMTASNTTMDMTIPQTPIDPQTGQPDENIVVDIYRFGGIILRWALVGTSPGGALFNDNTPDIDLLAAPSPSQITDASTGLTRFNLFRPFVTQDVARSGRATVFVDDTVYPVNNPAGTAQPAHLFMLQAASGPDGSTTFFNQQWLPGSTIFVTPDGGSQAAYTIYQVLNGGLLELAGDQSDVLSNGNFVNWTVQAGTLQSGQPLPHLWGPYGIGQSGSYIFACGDPNARGTLYWTNGNDPDSTDVVNNIIVTSPSEKLITGCIYDGQGYCWSTDRQFTILPSITIFGQFTTNEVAGAKGCWLEWSLSVQNNGISDQSVTWRGKDGIYDFSNTGGLNRISDPLYPFFPHDGAPGIAPETLIEPINATAQNPEHVGNLDDTQPKYHRLTWFQGVLFYDFLALSTLGATYSTLIYDSVNIPNGGWMCVDQPFTINSQPNMLSPITRMVEIGSNDPNTGDVENGPTYGSMARGGNMRILYSAQAATDQNAYIMDYYGYDRNGFESRVITKSNDLGDSRQPKVWGDYWFDATPLNNVINVTPYVSLGMQPLIPSVAAPEPPIGQPTIRNRTQYTFDFQEFIGAGGKGMLNPSLALDVDWIASDGQFSETIYQWAATYIPKPEFIEFRVSDPDDAGNNQAKYLMGCNIEANTQGETVGLQVIVDLQNVAQLNLNHEYQSEKPYAFSPVAGYEFQVQMYLGPAMNALELFKISWIFEVWPDATARKYPFMSYGETGAKFIQGAVMPIETGGNPAKIGLYFDDSNTQLTWTKQTLPLVKTGTVFDFAEPVIAHEVQWQTFPQEANPPGNYSTDAGPGARIWPQEAKIVWQPIPENTETWQTEPSNWGFCTWWSLREAYVAVMGGPNGSSAPQMIITDEYGSMTYTLDLLSANQFVRFYRVLAPQKSKWKSFRVQCPGGVRLFNKDTCIFAKEWGSDGPYIAIHPFGDQSNTTGAPI